MANYNTNCMYRLDTPRNRSKRIQSAREFYRPAIADLSQQAFYVTNNDGYDSTMHSYDSVEKLNENHHNNPPYIDHDITEPLRPLSETALGCLRLAENQLSDWENANSKLPHKTKLPDFKNLRTDDYRERIAKSAINRSKLFTLYKRPRSLGVANDTPAFPRTIPSRLYGTPDWSGNLGNITPGLLVTHCDTPNGIRSLDRENIKSRPSTQSQSMRPLSRCRTTFGTLLSDGSETHVNGFYQQLVHTHPVIKQSVDHWVTTGFKVQSLRLKNSGPALPRRNPISLRNRRKLSEHTLVEEYKKIKIGQQKLQTTKSCHTDKLTSSLMVSNIHVPTDRSYDQQDRVFTSDENTDNSD